MKEVSSSSTSSSSSSTSSSSPSTSSSSPSPSSAALLTCVDAGAGGRDAKLGLDELGDEGDEGGYYGALRRVGEADEEEGDVAEDPHRSLGQVWERGRVTPGEEDSGEGLQTLRGPPPQQKMAEETCSHL